MSRIRQALASDKITRYLAIIATILTLPALFHGFEADDRIQRMAALDLPTSPLSKRTPFNLYTFYDDPASVKRLMEYGIATWWSDLDLRVTFLRPISSLLLWCDHHVLKHPFLVHAHSLLWYLFTIAVAAALYRRFIREAWIAGLAGLMFAVDHSHGVAAGWIAQRNTLITGLFGLLTLYFHDRARRGEGRAREMAIASICLGLGLFSGEASLAVLPYLLAHAITFDRQRWFRALLPYAPPVLLWMLVYKLGRFGAHASGLYVDPSDTPLEYLTNMLQHAPILISGELELLGGDFYAFVPPGPRLGLLVAAVLVIALFLAALRPLWREDPATRFFVLGAILSVLPSCATAPSSRLTFLTSFGVVGALAQIIGGWRDRANWFPTSGFARLRSMPVVLWCGLGHLFLSPLLFVVALHQTTVGEGIITRLAHGLPDDPHLASQQMIVVNPPDVSFVGIAKLIRSDEGKPSPNKAIGLSSGTRSLELTRTGESTAVLSSKVGLVQPGTDMLTRKNVPFVPGYVVNMSELSIEVTRINESGWPIEAKITFTRPLEDATYRWMQWKDQTLVPLSPPKIGETISFPEQALQFF